MQKEAPWTPHTLALFLLSLNLFWPWCSWTTSPWTQGPPENPHTSSLTGLFIYFLNVEGTRVGGDRVVVPLCPLTPPELVQTSPERRLYPLRLTITTQTARPVTTSWRKSSVAPEAGLLCRALVGPPQAAPAGGLASWGLLSLPFPPFTEKQTWAEGGGPVGDTH